MALENYAVTKRKNNTADGRLQVKSKIWLEKNGKLVFGSGKAVILRSILKTGSINKAAKELNMSYRHAWSYIRSVEKRIGYPLLVKVKGGKDGGGADLTPQAKAILKKFEKLEQEAELFTNKCFKKIFGAEGEDGSF